MINNFNKFEPLLDEAPKYGKWLYCLGKQGDETIMYNDVNRWKGDNKRTMGELLVYDKSTMSLTWKAIYKNTRGFYFKKDKNYYLNFDSK